jgi:hypothetical protein
LYNSVPIKDVLDGQYHYQILLNIKHCSPLTPTDIDTYQRDGYIEFQFSDGGYDDVVLVRALLRAGLLEADYYESTSRVKNPTLEL